MAHVESSGTTTTSTSSTGSPSLKTPRADAEQQSQPCLKTSIVFETANVEGKESDDSIVLDSTTRSDDDDVLFIFSVPRSKKRQRRRLESLHTPVVNQPCEHRSNMSNASPDYPARRGTTGMVQDLESCHIADNDNKPDNIRGTSLPIVPLPAPAQLYNTQLQPVDPTTEPNFVAMQDMLPDSCLQWWNEPETNFQTTQTNPSSWMDFQDEPPPSTQNGEDIRSEGRTDSVDDQISPRTKPATHFHANDNKGAFSADARGLERIPNDPMTHQPPSYPSSRMPSWSKNWSAFSDTGNKTFTRARIPSSTPLSIVRNAFRPNQQCEQQGQVYHRAIQYPQQHTANSQRFAQGQPSHVYERYDHLARVAFMGTSQSGVTRRPELRNADTFMTSSQHQNSSLPQSPCRVQSPANIQQLGEPIWPIPSPPRIDNPNDVLRKPSLYKIPTWSAQEPSGTTEAPPPISSSSVRQHPPGTIPPHLSYRQNPNLNMTMSPPPPPPYQPVGVPEPPPSRRRGAKKFSPNLIVDIAETCQQLFPFAMIADRHSVPIQKVFDTFSAIIQLPLLRNADDKRRHGSLGKRRMRDFRAAKKKMAEEMRGVKRSGEDMGAGGEKRVRRDQPLLRCAVMNNARERDGGN